MVPDKSVLQWIVALLPALFPAFSVTAELEVPLVDPTRPVAFSSPAVNGQKEEKKLSLQAIYYGAERQEALINGRLVKVGDVIDNTKILAIAPGSVRYTRAGTTGEMVLFPSVLKPAEFGN